MRTAVDTGTVQEYMACLSEKVRRLINAYDMEETREMICEAMKEYPDAAQPHNLLGILMETQGNHVSAMKHFRAARVLDPTFLPARENMENFGSFSKPGAPAYTMEDCGKQGKKERFKIEYDENGAGHVVKRSSEKPGFFH